MTYWTNFGNSSSKITLFTIDTHFKRGEVNQIHMAGVMNKTRLNRFQVAGAFT